MRQQQAAEQRARMNTDETLMAFSAHLLRETMRRRGPVYYGFDPASPAGDVGCQIDHGCQIDMVRGADGAFAMVDVRLLPAANSGRR